MLNFFNKLFESDLPNEGIIVVIITSITAILSNLLNQHIKKNRKSSDVSDSKVIGAEDPAMKLLSGAFDEMKVTVDYLRKTQEALRAELMSDVDKWREMYYEQVAINVELNTTISMLTKEINELNQEVDVLTKKVELLLSIKE